MFSFLFVCFWGHGQLCSGINPGSELRAYSWRTWGTCGSRGSNLGQPCARQVPSPSYYYSGLCFYFLIKEIEAGTLCLFPYHLTPISALLTGSSPEPSKRGSQLDPDCQPLDPEPGHLQSDPIWGMECPEFVCDKGKLFNHKATGLFLQDMQSVENAC